MRISKYEIVREAPKRMTEQETVDYYLSRATPHNQGYDKPCLYLNVWHDKHGYTGVTTPIDSKNQQLHRMICNVNTKGGIKEGNHVRHYPCNTPWCIEPSHLLEGTHYENMQDKIAAGTSNRGEKCHMAILTESNVIEIRRLKAGSGWSNKRLGIKFGVHPSTITRIIRGTTWRHLDEQII